jgi:hypothetical protein
MARSLLALQVGKKFPSELGKIDLNHIDKILNLST